MIKNGLCFDLDGTIIDSVTYGLKKLEKIVTSRGLPYDSEIEAKVLALFGLLPLHIIKTMWPNSDAEQIVIEWGDDKDFIPLFPGTEEALKQLSNKYHMSILTSRPRQSTLFQVSRFGDLFKFVVAHEDVQSHKPDPKSMEPVIGQYRDLGINLKDIIYVGDTVGVDWRLAINTSINFYAVTTGVNTAEDFRRAKLRRERILRSVADLPNILLK